MQNAICAVPGLRVSNLICISHFALCTRMKALTLKEALRSGQPDSSRRRRQPCSRLSGRWRLAAVHQERRWRDHSGRRWQRLHRLRDVVGAADSRPRTAGAGAGDCRAARRGISFGAPSPLEHELGEQVRRLMPSLERVRFVSSGTEAAMSALRVARAFTRRDRIIKFEGCYHGHADAFLVKAGSGALTLGIPTSPGVPASVAADTLLARYNDLHSVDALLTEHDGSIAAIIVEPIAGNIGVVPPADDFLTGLRERCTRSGSLLIFDEVISGFRASAGGAQAIFGVPPDLTCLGKIIGGGLPVGAYGGRADIMDLVAPAGRSIRRERSREIPSQ